MLLLLIGLSTLLLGELGATPKVVLLRLNRLLSLLLEPLTVRDVGLRCTRVRELRSARK